MSRRVLVIGKEMNYNLDHYIVRALQKTGNEVKFVGYRDILGKHYSDTVRMLWARSKLIREISVPIQLKKVNEVYYNLATTLQPDIVLSLKGETLLPAYIKKIRKDVGSKTMLWYPDDPRFFGSLAKHISPHYDVVFTSSQNAISLYNKIGVTNVHRLPFACDPEVHNDKEAEHFRINKALFIGTFSFGRYKFIKELIRSGIPIDLIGSKWPATLSKYVVSHAIFGKQYVSALRSYSVVLNIHQEINYGPNMRTFETTGSGGLLLSDKAEDIATFFDEDREIQLFDSVDGARRKIKNIIEGKGTFNDISTRAMNKCHEKYTYEARAKEILNWAIG